jgi:glyoxylate carboligase
VFGVQGSAGEQSLQIFSMRRSLQRNHNGSRKSQRLWESLNTNFDARSLNTTVVGFGTDFVVTQCLLNLKNRHWLCGLLVFSDIFGSFNISTY